MQHTSSAALNASPPAGRVNIRFAPALGAWISQQLDQGWAPAHVVQTMCERRVGAREAHAIVDAFVSARFRGTPLPVDTVELPPLAPSSQLRSGTSIQTTDRRVRVAARVEQPTLAVLNNVLSPEECAQLIELARPRLRPSTLVDPETGRDVTSGLRASLGMFFRPLENELVARIDRRLAELMHLPLENGEGLQILHYPCGAGSAPHYDFLQASNEANRASIARSGQRISTTVCYLNDVPEGGETVFPELGWAVSPQQGNAVYFESCDAQGALIQASVHASQAVTLGEKWVATKWTRTQRFVSAGKT